VRVARSAWKGMRLLAMLGTLGMVASCGYGSHLNPPASQGGIQANFSSDQTASGPWGEFATQGQAGQFDFSVDPLALVPGEPVYAPVALRAVSGVTTPVSVNLRPALTTQGSIADLLRYSVSEVPAASCNESGFGTATIVNDQPISQRGGDFTLQPDTIRTLCFRVELPDGTKPHEAASRTDTVALWEFRAEGDDPPAPPNPGGENCHRASWSSSLGSWRYFHCWFFQWKIGDWSVGTR